jgi:hypothetical protein
VRLEDAPSGVALEGRTGAEIAGEALRLEGAVSVEEAVEVKSPRFNVLVLLDGL